VINSTKWTVRKQIQKIKQSFFQVNGLPLNDILTDDMLKRIAEEGGNYRDKVFTPLNTLKTFLWQVLSENGSCKEAVANVLVERIEQGLPPNSVNTGPYCKARRRLPVSPIVSAVKETGDALHQQTKPEWKWRDYNVLMVDGTTMLMADTEENQKEFPQQSVQKPGLGFPIVRLVGLISLSVGSLKNYAISAYQGKGSGESSLFSLLIETIIEGDLLLADRYYCTYAIVALMQHQDAPVVFRNHAKKITDFRRGKKLGPKDHLIHWAKPKRKPTWMSEADYEKLPTSLQVREFAVNGIVYVTTLSDASCFHKKEIASLYQKRWKIELDIRTIKTDMGMEMLRCKTPEMVKKEIAVYLLAYNLIRTTIAQAAKRHNKLPRSLSVKAAIQLLSAARQQVRKQPSITFTAMILKAIASTMIGQRKRKPQPRAVKRRPKAYPLLMESREIACSKLIC